MYFCVCFAVVGIPLFLGALSSVGYQQTRFVRWWLNRQWCTNRCVDTTAGDCKCDSCRSCVDRLPDSGQQLVQTVGDRCVACIDKMPDGCRQVGQTVGDRCLACIDKLPDGCRQLVPTVRDRCVSSADWVVAVVIIAVGTVVLFCVIPAAIFHNVEGWTYEASLYYTVTTLLTIGFGDYVPGKTFSDVRSDRTD